MAQPVTIIVCGYYLSSDFFILYFLTWLPGGNPHVCIALAVSQWGARSCAQTLQVDKASTLTVDLCFAWGTHSKSGQFLSWPPLLLPSFLPLRGDSVRCPPRERRGSRPPRDTSVCQDPDGYLLSEALLFTAWGMTFVQFVQLDSGFREGGFADLFMPPGLKFYLIPDATLMLF